MKEKTIIFMGTPSIAAEYLDVLIKHHIEIKGVFTQSPKKKFRGMRLSKSPVHLLAEKKKINVYHPNNFDPEAISILKKIQPHLIIVMAYGNILPKSVLELPKFGCINIHVSILPRWRGAAPIEHTLMNGDKETGISIIKLVEKLDAGPIIAQEKLTIPKNFNKLQLTHSLTTIGSRLLVKIIPKVLNNEIEFKYQNEKYATYANKINSETRKINFNSLTQNIINNIRAHSPKPGAWFFLKNERIKIIEAKKGTSRGNASTILNKNFEIGTKDGSIEPLILQREGKKIVQKEDFLRGYILNIGDKINV